MLAQQINQFLLQKLSVEDWCHLQRAWVNEINPKEVAKELRIPVELVRGAYFAKDLSFAEDNQGLFFSQSHG